MSFKTRPFENRLILSPWPAKKEANSPQFKHVKRIAQYRHQKTKHKKCPSCQMQSWYMVEPKIYRCSKCHFSMSYHGSSPRSYIASRAPLPEGGATSGCMKPSSPSPVSVALPNNASHSDLVGTTRRQPVTNVAGQSDITRARSEVLRQSEAVPAEQCTVSDQQGGMQPSKEQCALTSHTDNPMQSAAEPLHGHIVRHEAVQAQQPSGCGWQHKQFTA